MKVSKIELSLSNGMKHEVEGCVFGDWAVHEHEHDGEIVYRITHVPSGLAMPEKFIGYLSLSEAMLVAQRFATECAAMPKVPTDRDGAEWRYVFEAIVAEVVSLFPAGEMRIWR